MDLGPEAEYVYQHPTYNALIEAHMRACPENEPVFSPNASPLCKYLTSKLSAANWMIFEGVDGETVIEFIGETVESAPSASDYYKE